MKKILLILFVALGLAFCSNAQEQDRDANAKQAVQESHRTLMSVMENGLENHNTKQSPKFGKAGDGTQQFLIDKSVLKVKKKVLVFFKTEATTLSSIYGQMCGKTKGFNTDFYYDTKVVPVFKSEGDPKGKNKDNCAIYTTRCETGVNSTKEGVKSSVKCDVTFNWLVTFGKKDVNKNKVESVVLSSINVSPKDLLDKDKAKITNNINDAIAKWYRDLNNNTADFGKMGLKAGECDRIDVDLSKVKNLPVSKISKEVTVKGPSFNVVATPQAAEKSIKDDLSAYDLPLNFYWKVTPTFSIEVDLDNLTCSIKDVSYAKEPCPPQTSNEKAQKRKAAERAVKTFYGKLNDYATLQLKDKRSANGKKMREEIQGMFVNKKTPVQFTLIKNGKEDRSRVKTPTNIESYLNKMPEAKVEITRILKSKTESNDKVSVEIIQTYQQQAPKKYTDETRKILYLVEDNGKWLIEEIVATEDPTILISNE